MSINQTPLKPEHADYVKPIKGAPGFEVARHLMRYAYARNGNTGNPTPRYDYRLLLDGKLVYSHTRYRRVIAAATMAHAREAWSA